MGKIKTFEEYNYIKNISETLENKISQNEIEDVLLTEFFGIGKLLGKMGFINPMKKNKIKKLSADLIKMQVEIVKLSLENGRLEAEMEELEDEMDDYERGSYSNTKQSSKSAGYGSSRGSSNNENPSEQKRAALENSIKNIEDKMDILGDDNEKLKKFIELQKIESKIKANELIIKLADDEQKKVLQKFNDAKSKKLKSLASDLEKEAE